MEVDLEKLISLITAAVIKELKAQNAEITVFPKKDIGQNHSFSLSLESKKLDLSKYRTPLVTENHIDKLHELVGEIVVPQGTIFTPKAKEKIREKNLHVTYEM